MGLRLVRGSADRLDPDWVRRQFELNGLVGRPASADQFVTLVLLINEAFVQNGYINTGLRFPDRAWPGAEGEVALWLIVGSVTPLAPGCPTIEVTWKGDHRRTSDHRPACVADSALPRPLRSSPGRAEGNPLHRAVTAVQDLGHGEGSGGLRPSYVRDRMAAARRTPLDIGALEREFRLLSDDEALRSVNADLRPGVRPGEAHLSLIVAPQPRLDVYAMVASSRTPSIGGIRYSGGTAIRNLLFSGDVLGVEGGETRGLADGTVDYSTPLFWPSARLELRGGVDQAAVLDPAVLALGIRSSDTSFEATLRQRLIDQPLTPPTEGRGWRPSQRLEAAIRFATRHSQSFLDGAPFSFSPGSVNGVTDVEALRAELDYLRRDANAVMAVSGIASFGLAGSGSDLPGPTVPSPRFEVVLVRTSYLVRLPRLFAGGVELRVGADGQWSDGPLYVSEQFSAGGDTVRGYRQNDLLADEGLRGSIEIYCPIGFGHGLCDRRATDWKSIRLSLFTDGAYMHNHAAAQPRPSGIGAIGLAIAWSPNRAITAEVSYAPLRLSEHRLGPLDIQDRGFQFGLTVHPLASFASN